MTNSTDLKVTANRLHVAVRTLWVLANGTLFEGIICSIIAIANFFMHGPILGFGIAGVLLYVASVFLEKVFKQLEDVEKTVLIALKQVRKD
jgi:hypothetical protein